jgi:DNA-binding transcriptional LysR family regulator
MNKLELAEALITVADCGSIYKASIKLNQTNAAISKKLTRLEEYLGNQLLIRNRKGISLTDAGQRYYHEAKLAIEQLKTAEFAVKQNKDKPRGNLKVVCNQFYAEKILKKLPEFLKQFPGIHVNLEVDEILPDFNIKKMDILYGVSLAATDNVVRKKIAQTRYVLCASKAYLKSNSPRSIAELMQHGFIAHSARNPSNMIDLDNEQILIRPKLLLNSTSLIIEAALQGLGIIWTHEDMVHELLQKKALISILDEFTQKPIEVYAYYAYQKYKDPKIQVFLDFFA